MPFLKRNHGAHGLKVVGAWRPCRIFTIPSVENRWALLPQGIPALS